MVDNENKLSYWLIPGTEEGVLTEDSVIAQHFGTDYISLNDYPQLGD